MEQGTAKPTIHPLKLLALSYGLMPEISRLLTEAQRRTGGDMKIRMKLFAVARQWADADSVEMDLPPNATIGVARAALINKLPKLSELGHHLRFAVDEEYADDNTPIFAGSNVACIPPVSGG